MHLRRDIKIKFAFLPLKLDDGEFIWLKKYKQTTIWVDEIRWVILSKLSDDSEHKIINGEKYHVSRGK